MSEEFAGGVLLEDMETEAAGTEEGIGLVCACGFLPSI